MGIAGVPVNRKKLLEAIKKCRGCVAKVCRMMTMTTSAFYVYRNTDPEVALVLDEARDHANIEDDLEDDAVIDMAYKAIKEMIVEKDAAAVIYTLSTLGRKRNKMWARAPLVDQTIDNKFTVQFETEDVNQINVQGAVVPTTCVRGDEDEEESLSSLS